MSRFKRQLPLAVLAGLVLLGACADQDAIVTPATDRPGGELFARYVSLGNSITAGLQSAGINDSTQREAYPVLLARQAGFEQSFGIPALAFPGCPPPFNQPLGPTRIGPPVDCALRRAPVPEMVNNLAVPGARIADLLDNFIPAEQLGAANALTTFILGGRTQIEAMQQANPTLVSVWIGNNDALAAAVSGDLRFLTPLAAFEERLDQIVTAIQGTDAQDAIFIGTIDAVTAAPILQPGAFFWALGQTPGGLPKPVNNNCAPINPTTGQPNPLGANMVSFRILADPNFPEVNCSPDAYPQGDPRRGIHLLTLQEQAAVRARVAEFNEVTRERAVANGWLYMDPNETLAPFLQQGPPFNQIRKCQMLSTATPATFQQAVLQSCPVPPQVGGAPNFFGALVSFDGVHPSGAGHRAIANDLIQLINGERGLSIPAVAVN